MISISVREYYRAVHFRHMPAVVFDALEVAFLSGSEIAYVREVDFLKMIIQIEIESGIKNN